MPSDRNFIMASRLIVIIGLPAYIGLRDQSLAAFALYAVVAGMGLAIAERFTISHFRGEPLPVVVQQALVQSLIILVVGLPIYFALILAV